MVNPFLPLWAVHIADGVLAWPWLLGGFVVAGLLALLACWRLRDEDVPRIALLAAAFFVASSIHVRFPGSPSSVHLLLSGLVGVILGWRAPLAILLGITLQALLISHGGVSAIGVNTCTQAIPALICGTLFPLLRAAPPGSVWARRGLLAATALLWGGCLLVGVAVLRTTPIGDLFRAPSEGRTPLHEALGLILHPLALALLVVFAAGCSLLRVSRELAIGVLLGVFSVLGTVMLNGVVLLLGGNYEWALFVSVDLMAHLPLALLEGVILGTTVGFLARVKPEMVGARPGWARGDLPDRKEEADGRLEGIRPRLPVDQGLAALMCVLCLGGPAWAHGLEATYLIDHAKRTVTITAVYETGDAPLKGKVEVTGPEDQVLASGETDREGTFVFRYESAGPFKVQIKAEGGHGTRFTIPARELVGDAQPSAPSREGRLRDLAVGIALLLALAAFVQSWLNARRLKRLEAARGGSVLSEPRT